MQKFSGVQFGIQFSTWDVGSMSGKWGEISETFKDVLLIFAAFRRYGGKDNDFKFLWSGCCKADNVVGVIVANWLIRKVVGSQRLNDRVIKISIVIGEVVWEVVSCYRRQASRSINEKEKFFELMHKVVTSEKVLVGGNFNSHIGSDMGGFGEVHGGFRIGKINDRGVRFLEWEVGKRLPLVNTCFQERKYWLITFRSGATETMMDYILVNSKYRSSDKDVKVIPGEKIVNQHCLLDGYSIQKESQEESKIQKEIETVKVERFGGEGRVC